MRPVSIPTFQTHPNEWKFPFVQTIVLTDLPNQEHPWPSSTDAFVGPTSYVWGTSANYPDHPWPPTASWWSQVGCPKIADEMVPEKPSRNAPPFTDLTSASSRSLAAWRFLQQTTGSFNAKVDLRCIIPTQPDFDDPPIAKFVHN